MAVEEPKPETTAQARLARDEMPSAPATGVRTSAVESVEDEF